MFLATLERFPNWQRDLDLLCLFLNLFLASRKRTRSNPFILGWQTERGMSQHEADLEFSFGKDAWKAIKMRMLEFVLIWFCISTFFTMRTNLNRKKNSFE